LADFFLDNIVNNKGLLIVFSGPSGVGKDTILRKMVLLEPNLVISVSATTRKPRINEVDKKDYFFLRRTKFKRAIENSEFLEYVSYCGEFYGTFSREVVKLLNAGKFVVLKIDVQGGLRLINDIPGVLSVFILPPSEEVLCERLKNRGFDNKTQMKNRLEQARFEVEQSKKYGFRIINDDVEECSRKIIGIIHKFIGDVENV
jgi:guanylate kinase